jgi:S-methylmethionine-dependent homocysteine/selenocysteine methylase
MHKIGHDLSQIKAILVEYYPNVNKFAVNCSKMNYSKSNIAWEAEIESTTKGYYRFEY